MNNKDKKNLIELMSFLDADMPSKIFPEEILKKEVWAREDKFLDKKEVEDYLRQHFLIAFPELKEKQNE